MKTPLLNALLASLYIILIVSSIYYAPRFVEPEESVLIPITFLSLFVLSAAVMGFLFLSQPLQLLASGERKEAVLFFLKTVAVFGATVCALALLMFITPLYITTGS